MGKLVAYYRVSTRKQGESGLGLEAQQSCVADYARYGQYEVIGAYREIETGKRADRPQLANALAHARRAKATLVIAKLDRLARNVHFLSGLMEAGVEFVCCDIPSANRLTLHILAAVAEDEARRISERTKAAPGSLQGQGWEAGHSHELDARGGHAGDRSHEGEGASRLRRLAARGARVARGWFELPGNRGSPKWRRPRNQDWRGVEPQPGQAGVVPRPSITSKSIRKSRSKK